jgi:SAM-dependent methyltransferase
MSIKEKKPWPTQAAMEQIYKRKLWGGLSSEFYSGDGSHHPEILNPYIEVVTSFLSSFEAALIVCDLGCGDFNVGKHLVKHTQKYIAVDIVEDLIDRNKKLFKEDPLEFLHLDIAKERLPKADCALVRQVLQHLSNAEVQCVTQKLSNFKYVILTEHIPEGDFVPNEDIISGQGTRLKKQSGLDLLASPFHLQVKDSKTLLSLTDKENKGLIVTKLYRMF